MDGQKDMLVREARLQADACRRLDAWARPVYSLFAVGALLAWWTFQGTGPDWAGTLGVILMAVFGVASVVFKVGTAHAKRNVRRILHAVGVDLDVLGRRVTTTETGGQR